MAETDEYHDTYTTSIVEQLQLVCDTVMPRVIAENFGEPAQVEVFARQISDDLMLRVRQRVWGEELERVELPSPADWWQAVKERWFPEWAKRRWPVQWLTHVVKLHALYPKRCFPLEESYPRVALDLLAGANWERLSAEHSAVPDDLDGLLFGGKDTDSRNA